MRTARWIFPSRGPQAWGWSRGEPGRRGKRLMEETGPGVTRCRVSNQTTEQVFERVATHRSSGASLARALGLMPACRYTLTGRKHAPRGVLASVLGHATHCHRTQPSVQTAPPTLPESLVELPFLCRMFGGHFAEKFFAMWHFSKGREPTS